MVIDDDRRKKSRRAPQHRRASKQDRRGNGERRLQSWEEEVTDFHDSLCSELRTQLRASAVCLIVLMGAELTGGFSIDSEAEARRNIPAALRFLAERIEREVGGEELK